MQVSHCDLTSFHKLPSSAVIFTCEGTNLTVLLAAPPFQIKIWETWGRKEGVMKCFNENMVFS